MAGRARHRLWLETLTAGPLPLTGERAHYLRDVLRLEPGDVLTTLGGDGSSARARVTRVAPEGVEIHLDPPLASPLPLVELTVALPAPKGERADWVVEKLTELGVSRILWIKTERTVVLPRAQGSRTERWSRIAQAAARQSGRARVPDVRGPISWRELLAIPAHARYVGDPAGESLVRLHAKAGAVRTVLFVVGPEGGLTAFELSAALESGYIAVGLGPHTLRTETAALAAAAVLLCDTQLAIETNAGERDS